MTEQVNTREKETRFADQLGDFGQRIDRIVTNAGVPWLFNLTEALPDGTFVMLVHRQTENENDYWVRHHTQQGIAAKNLRGTAYEELRWDAKEPGDVEKQLVMIFIPSRSREPQLARKGFGVQDIGWVDRYLNVLEGLAKAKPEESGEADG